MFDAICIDLPMILKARTENGKRLVEVEASNTKVDTEGDVILQCALLDSAPSFLKNGNIDIDHQSEVGHRSAAWIIGAPTEVKDLGEGRTGVICELHQPRPGVTSKADEVWDSLMSDPPVRWRASIYGFPLKGMLEDARITKCADAPEAKRYVVKGLDWRSLALTRNPINDAIVGEARVITAKAFMREFESLSKGPSSSFPLGQEPSLVSTWQLPPRNRDELLGQYYTHICKGECPHAGKESLWGNSVLGFREHFYNCTAMEPDTADIHALALMQILKREKKN